MPWVSPPPHLHTRFPQGPSSILYLTAFWAWGWGLKRLMVLRARLGLTSPVGKGGGATQVCGGGPPWQTQLLRLGGDCGPRASLLGVAKWGFTRCSEPQRPQLKRVLGFGVFSLGLDFKPQISMGWWGHGGFVWGLLQSQRQYRTQVPAGVCGGVWSRVSRGEVVRTERPIDRGASTQFCTSGL